MTPANGFEPISYRLDDYAALDENDADHAACADLITNSDEQLVVPEPVLVELDYWLRKNATVDVWLAFADDIAAGLYPEAASRLTRGGATKNEHTPDGRAPHSEPRTEFN